MAELISRERLRLGRVLRQPLFSRHGVKLVGGGVELTSAIIDALRASGETEFVLADAATEVTPPPPSAPRSAPRGNGRKGGPTNTPPGPMAALNRVRLAILRRADDIVASKMQRWGTLSTRIAIGVDAVRVASDGATTALSSEELVRLREQRVIELRTSFGTLAAGLPTPLEPLNVIVEELISLYAQHPRRFAELALNAPLVIDHLPDHAYSVAALAVAAAARLQWPRREVARAGLTGLLADAGMLAVPHDMQATRRALEEIEINRVRRHPAMGVVLLEAIEGLPEVVPMAVYQHHERENTTGYPRGLSAGAIHPIAKVVAAADTFAALIEARPHRARMLPAAAMRQVIRLAASGLLDRASVRGLVESVGLFPVSTAVQLSDGSIARVIAAGSRADRPLVQRVATAEMVDLAVVGAVSIVRGVDLTR